MSGFLGKTASGISPLSSGSGFVKIEVTTPLIGSVSQNAGTINGGTVISVIGSNFMPGMTSTLGTVSAITPTTCTITTNSHVAGAFTWTLTNGTLVSGGQSFTYLGHPGTPSVSPNAGPDNAIQVATFTSSNLPFGFTGVPFSITVGGASVTSLSPTASTTATGTISSGGTDGAQNVVISVDGVSATGTGVYTFLNVPTISSVSQNAGTIDGSSIVNVTGTQFYAGMTSTLGAVSAITSTTCTIATNSHAAGAFTWTLTNVTGSSSNQTFTYLAHPAAPTVSPLFGPDNTTQAATFTSTNLPFGFSGVPFTMTVGSLTVVTLSATASTTATGTIPSGGIDGVQSVTVTVDGVSATTASGYTFRGIPTVSSVSQNAGTINGSTAINVTGSQFFSGMTSTLGTVSAITPTTCTITTNSGSAGAFTWTVTNTTSSSANQSYTYLAHPGVPTVSPLFGPDNAINAVTFTSTSLPFGFSGVPFSCTVGGLSVTSLSATASTTATGTIPSGGADGAQNVIITVDGVSATGTGAYTFRGIPTVSSISQNAGTIDGLSTVNVIGTQFFSGMTSTLGTVSAITSTTCTITTNSHAAGAFTWTLTNTTGTSANQTFTYLAHPGTPSVSPNSGPDNATQAATFTSSSLPFGFTGVPFSMTVGGLTVTSLSATNSTTATGTIPSGGADGAANVVVSVDGVSSTGTGAYSFIGTPIVTLATPNIGSAAGGWSLTLTGTYFTGASSVKINGVSCTSVSVVNDSTITCVAPSFGNNNGSATGQTIAVTTSIGTGSSTSTANKYFYLPCNTTIEFFHRADVGVTSSGGLITSWVNQVPGITSTYTVSGSGTTSPATPSGNFNSTGLPYVTFLAANKSLTCGLGATIVNGLYFYAMMMQLPSAGLSANPNYYNQIHGPAFDNIIYNQGSTKMWYSDAVSGAFGVTTSPDTNAHVVGVYPGTGGTAKTFYDGTSTTGTVNPATNCNTNQIGGWQATHSTFNFLGDILYSAIPSAGDITTIMQILRTTANTA